MAYRQVPGMAETPPERPQHVEPVPEHYQGVNFPYRGTENHGVAAPDHAEYDTREFEATFEDEANYLPAEAETPPIAVRVVNKTARERREFRSSRFTLTDSPQQMLGRNDKRTSVRIRSRASNTGTAWVGPDNGVNALVSYGIAAGAELTDLDTTEEIWGVADATKTLDLFIIETYAVEL